MTREKFIDHLEKVCTEYPDHFVFKEDAGLRVIQCSKFQFKETFYFQSSTPK
jgi:hypothetical protein